MLLPDGGLELIQARLNILERQGRFDEFLNFAGVMGVPDRRATMLVRLGRAEEALAYALERLTTAEEALSLARTLRESDDAERALQVAEHGLSLPGKWSTYDVYQATPPLPGELAIWTRDLAHELDRPELALRAARLAFEHETSLGSYLRAQEIAGDSWDALRPELLTYLRDHRSVAPAGHVDIFLHEGLIEDAVAAVENIYDWRLTARVADAAIATHPEWVITTGRRRAFAIMDEGRSSHYSEAVAWLRRVGEAERVLGHLDTWRTELDDLIAKHMRKYKLRPMLEDLRRRPSPGRQVGFMRTGSPLSLEGPPLASIEILIVLLLIVANGVLSGSEMAVVSARRARLQARAEAGDNGAAVALLTCREAGPVPLHCPDRDHPDRHPRRHLRRRDGRRDRQRLVG